MCLGGRSRGLAAPRGLTRGPALDAGGRPCCVCPVWPPSGPGSWFRGAASCHASRSVQVYLWGSSMVEVQGAAMHRLNKLEPSSAPPPCKLCLVYLAAKTGPKLLLWLCSLAVIKLQTLRKSSAPTAVPVKPPAAVQFPLDCPSLQKINSPVCLNCVFFTSVPRDASG